MPFIKSLVSKRYAYMVLAIILLSKIIPFYSRYIKKSYYIL